MQDNHALEARTSGLGYIGLLADALSFGSRTGRKGNRPYPTPAAAAPRERLLDRLDHWFWRQRQRSVEAYLGKAQDIFELEARIRDIERYGFSSW